VDEGDVALRMTAVVMIGMTTIGTTTIGRMMGDVTIGGVIVNNR
jgi:hypothetical protein